MSFDRLAKLILIGCTACTAVGAFIAGKEWAKDAADRKEEQKDRGR